MSKRRKTKSLQSMKTEAIQTAKQLGYSFGVIEKLGCCNSEGDIYRTMRDARESAYEWRENV